MPLAMTSEVRAQAGTQVDYTTAVTPTVSLRGIEELTLNPANEVEVLMDMTTGMAGGSQAVMKGISGAGSMSGWGSYEHLAYWLDNLLGQATPTGAFIRSYAVPVTTAPTPRILSLVKGTSAVGAYQLVGALLQSFTMRFEQRSQLQISGDLIGVKLQADTLEALAIPAVNPIMSQHLSGFKWDNWTGTMGATALDDCYIRFAEFVITPDRQSRPCFGTLSADQYIENPWEGTLELGLELNSTTKADVDAIVGGLTQRQVQMTATDTAARTPNLH